MPGLSFGLLAEKNGIEAGSVVMTEAKKSFKMFALSESLEASLPLISRQSTLDLSLVNDLA